MYQTDAEKTTQTIPEMSEYAKLRGFMNILLKSKTMIKGTILFLFPILLFSIFFAFPESHAQYMGETERYRFFIDESNSHEITFQSHVTRFNELTFDPDTISIRATVGSDSTLADTILVHLDTKSFNELFSKETKTLPTDILILLDEAEQEYEIISTSQKDLIVWKFKNMPHTTEIELIRNPNVIEMNPGDEYPYGLSPTK